MITYQIARHFVSFFSFVWRISFFKRLLIMLCGYDFIHFSEKYYFSINITVIDWHILFKLLPCIFFSFLFYFSLLHVFALQRVCFLTIRWWSFFLFCLVNLLEHVNVLLRKFVARNHNHHRMCGDVCVCVFFLLFVKSLGSKWC